MAWSESKEPRPGEKIKGPNDLGESDDTVWMPGVKPEEAPVPTLSDEATDVVDPSGRYRILEKLGQGGMATVYKAYDTNVKRHVALKVLDPSLAMDDDYRARFLAEANLAGNLAHPNIVVVHDVGVFGKRPYIAMELLKGETLGTMLERGASFSAREVAAIGIQLARALDFAHEHGVIHRDIKPSNIIKLDRGSQIKVVDFGIAWLTSANDARHTRAGDILGTAHYMSPEQAAGVELDKRSDLFSVGVVLYQLLTGRKPFDAKNVVSLVMQISKEDPPSLSEARPDIPAGLRRAVEKCLRKQPDHRFQSGAELTEALTRVVRDLDEDASAASKRTIPLRFQWTAIIGLVVAATMALVGALIIERFHAGMQRLTVQHGISVCRSIADELAEPAAKLDWVEIEEWTIDQVKKRDLKSVVVTDKNGVIMVSNNGQPKGMRFSEPPGTHVESNVEDVKVLRYALDNGEKVLAFSSPLLVQSRHVGNLYIGLSEGPLLEMNRVGTTLVSVLIGVTLAVVLTTTYLLATRFSKPIQVLRESMAEIAIGRYDHRIGKPRKDEFGDVYRAFDRMALALQKRAEGEKETTTKI